MKITYLYDKLIEEFGKKTISRTEIPQSISDNLNSKFPIRSYQKEAFQRFIVFNEEPFDNKPNLPYHLLFNMATGSGKTMIMAGLILYLYEKGYRNFLFFVNSTNIIKKTEDNFLNTFSSKYLFNQKITINNQEVFFKPVQNFENTDNQNINICFTTIQQLHADLNTTKEGSLTFEDFQDKKIVLLADEAHHLNTATRNGSLFGTWENTVMEILNQNYENILLEFTATLDYESHEISTKYADKVIYKYDLAQFRNDGFSKEIDLIRTYFDEKQRIIQALILNLYRQELAASRNINLKPVILFKAKRTIAESELNKQKFHTIIENLSSSDIENIHTESTVEIVQKAFKFFTENNISYSSITQRIQTHFKPENCISANDDKEAERNQLILNSLEDDNNPIRAIFAVQKLNEGWDVLNLFDIVRLYEGQNTGGSNQGKKGNTTLSEAQLIGRGARYFPFNLNDNEDKYKRKYKNTDFEILEQLFYHTKEESRYISEIKAALIESGIYEDDENLITKELKLKDSFKTSDLYKKGVVFANKRVEKSYEYVKSFADLGVKKQNIQFTLSSGIGKMSGVFDFELEQEIDKLGQKDILLKEIPLHIIRYAITTNPFFHFSSLRKYFPNLKSTTEFITSNEYLGNLSITFIGTTKRRNTLTNKDYLLAVNQLLNSIETDLKNNTSEYEGTDKFYPQRINDTFKDKKLRINKDDERAKSQADLIKNLNWYAYNDNFGTSEEKRFVELFTRKFEQLNHKYSQIYLLRNEREIKVYDSKGRAFEPDFILFVQKNSENINYQVFIEPKGKHLLKEDEWKNDFLKALRDKKHHVEINTGSYLITALPFYNSEIENEFEYSLFATL